MAEFKVQTNQLQSYATQIAAMQRELDSVSVRLGAMQLGSILRIRASTALVGRIGDCKWAAAHQSDDLGRLAQGLEEIAQLYETNEKNLSEPNTGNQGGSGSGAGAGSEAESGSIWSDFLDGLMNAVDGFVNIWGGGTGPVAVLYGLFGLGFGDTEGKFNGFKSIFEGASTILDAIVKLPKNADLTDWAEALLNLPESGVNGWDDAFNNWLDGMNLGKQTTGVGKASTLCKWAGYALSYFASGAENYGEFDGDMSNARFWGETFLEGSVDVGLGIAAGIAAAALLPASAPALLVGAAGTAVVWFGNEVCEWITGGRDIGEVVADAVCDATETVVEIAQDVGEAISDGVQAAWEGVCDWVSGWW